MVRWVVPILLVGLLIAFAGRELTTEGPSNLRIRPVPAAMATLLYVGHVFARGWIWHVMMRWCGADNSPQRHVSIWITTVLIGRYVPGKVATSAARVLAYRDRPIAIGSLSFCFLLDVVGTMVRACLVVAALGACAGPIAAYRTPAASTGLALLALVHPLPARKLLAAIGRLRGRAPEPVALAAWQCATAVGMLTGVWGLLGTAVVTLVSAVTPVATGDLPFVGAAFALSHVSGTLAIFTPGGRRTGRSLRCPADIHSLDGGRVDGGPHHRGVAAHLRGRRPLHRLGRLPGHDQSQDWEIK